MRPLAGSPSCARPTAFSLPEGVPEWDVGRTRARRQVEARLLDAFARRGYAEITLPTFEYADLYHRDRIGDELYHQLLVARVAEPGIFPDDASEGTCMLHDVVLRPDLTAPLARHVVSRALEAGALPDLPLRLAVAGQVFRNAPARAGGRKERRHVGVERVGGDTDAADREVLGLAVEAAQAAGLGAGELHLSDVRLLDTLLDRLPLSPAGHAAVRAHMEEVARVQGRLALPDADLVRWLADALPDLDQTLRRFRVPTPADLTRVDSRDPAAWRALLPDLIDAWVGRVWQDSWGLGAEASARLLALARLSLPADELPRALAALGVDDAALPALPALLALARELAAAQPFPVHVTPAGRRGIGYYSGLTFELHAPAAHALNGPLCGGGRYGTLYQWLLERAGRTASLRDPSRAPATIDPAALTSVGFAFDLGHLMTALLPDADPDADPRAGADAGGGRP